MTVTVPGNLLLLGEYAVLEEGGLGVTLALERRIVVRSESAPELEIEGSWGQDTVHWTDRHPESSLLFSEVVRACRRYLRQGPPRAAAPKGPTLSGGAGFPAPPEELGARIRIDSSAFFLSPDRKSGFGSSAAVTVGLVWSILILGGLDPDLAPTVVPRVALEAHRAAQGGGSGYDVFASAHGVTGLFTGGPIPGWQARPLPWLPPLYLLRGPRSVSSAGAVARYREWKAEHPAEACRFLQRSNAVVQEFVNAGAWSEAEAAFRRSREEGIRLGEAIGVPAALPLPASLEGAPFKAVGAGDELGVVAVPEAPDPAALAGGLEPLVAAGEGVRWRL